MSAFPNSMAPSHLEKEMLLELLRVSQDRFLGSFAGVGNEESRCHPAEGCWSILDTVEHLTTAEKNMLKLITSARRPRAADAPNREATFLRVLTDRSHKLESPEAGRPAGRYANLEQAAAEFKAAREGVMQFVAGTAEDLRSTEVTHPHPAAGNVSTFEMVIIIAKHAERHALQIEEIRNSPAVRAQVAAQG